MPSGTTRWPTIDACERALHAPSQCFTDVRLQHCTPVRDHFGTPYFLSGAAAAVWKLQDQGGNMVAVRTLHRPIPNVIHRYRAICAHLQNHPNVYLVPIELQESGLHLDGAHYPLLVAPWINGVSLLGYIEQFHRNVQAIRHIAHEFHTCIWHLRRQQIAHGDLQPRNMIVQDNGALKLLDFDGMFVPALAGLTSPTLGHPNFAHPKRSSCEYGPQLDAFSAWVIHISLHVLITDAALWHEARNRQSQLSDDGLLFTKSDFTDPHNSWIFTTLTAHPKLAHLSRQLRRMLAMSPGTIPGLPPPPPVAPQRPRFAAPSPAQKRSPRRSNAASQPTRVQHPQRPSMSRRERHHIFTALLLVSCLYLVCRMTGLTGSHAHVPFVTALLYPGMAIIALWGMWRLLKRL